MNSKQSERDVKERLEKLEKVKIRNKHRYELFDGKTYKKVLELNAFFEKYVIDYIGQYRRTYIYFDTPNRDLEISGISLYKAIVDGRCALTMIRSNVENEGMLLERLKGRSRTTPIGLSEGLEHKMQFMISAFKDMFATNVNFDPEYLLNKLQRAYEIETVTREYRLFNGVGLKIKMLFDSDNYFNHYTGRRNTAELFTLYQLSNQSTDEAYEDVVSKLERYCKEMTASSQHKTTVMLNKTKELIKEEVKQEVKKKW